MPSPFERYLNIDFLIYQCGTINNDQKHTTRDFDSLFLSSLTSSNSLTGTRLAHRILV